MPVDKFGRTQESNNSIVDGVSLTFINNNFLRRDGTNTATGSINMTGNTLTKVSEPVNAQDVATKNYVDSSNGGVDKVSKAGDTMTGDLNMGRNRIMNIPFYPVDTNDAVNASYIFQRDLDVNKSGIEKWNTSYDRAFKHG